MSELAVRHDSSVERIGPDANFPQPQYATGAMRLVEWAEEAQAANHLAKALCHTPFAGSWKGDENGATAAILKGAEVGLTPVTALGAFDNIQGQPAPKAITLRALVQSHGHDLEIIEETDEKAVARYRRNGAGDWLTTTFTMTDAAKMKLTGKDNWVKQPGAMLIARVTSKAARLVASDVILGIGYSAEELRDSDDYRALPTLAASQPAPAADRMAGILHVEQEQSEPVPPPDDEGITSTQLKKMGAAMGELKMTDRATAIAYVIDVIGREVSSRNDLSKAEASSVIDALEDEIRQAGDYANPPTPEPEGRES